MPKVTCVVVGTGLMMADYKKISHLTTKAEGMALKAAGRVLHRAVLANISVRDHTLQSLRNMDHPYAKRHGAIQVHPEAPYKVHRHTGRMANALYQKTLTGKPVFEEIGFDYARQKYFRYVLEGTKVMLPRNTLFLTSQIPSVRKDMSEQATKVFKAEAYKHHSVKKKVVR